MIKNKLCNTLLILSSVFSLSSHAAESGIDHKFRYPIYFGVTGGYGRTTWEGLVPEESSAAIMMSTPIRVDEGGVMWGAFAGYEFAPFFALEGTYTRYPNAKVTFSSDSLFYLDHNHLSNLNTHTETIALMAKIMMVIPHTTVRAYSSFGPAGIHRYDQVKEHWRTTATFGAGLNYNFTDQVMGEIGANYTAGYGVSELRPAEDYLPFLYSMFVRVGYRFDFC